MPVPAPSQGEGQGVGWTYLHRELHTIATFTNPLIPSPRGEGQVEGNVFDRGVDAFERYFLQDSFPLTPTLSNGRGCFGIVTQSRQRVPMRYSLRNTKSLENREWPTRPNCSMP